jgi:hypothetical protein
VVNEKGFDENRSSNPFVSSDRDQHESFGKAGDTLQLFA